MVVGCAATPPANEAQSAAKPEVAEADAPKKSNNAEKLSKLASAITKTQAFVHEFTDEELQKLFTAAIKQAGKTLATDLSTVSLITHDQDKLLEIKRAQIAQSASIFPPFNASSIRLDRTVAIYDGIGDQVVLNSDFGKIFPPVVGKSRKLAREFITFVFLHELVHAYDFRRERLKLLWPSGRSAVNHGAVREGHAQYWAKVMCRKKGCKNYIRKQSVAIRKPWISGSSDTEYVYVAGERFVTHIMQEDNAVELIDRAFAQPPTDEFQIVLPDLYTRSKVNRDEFNVALSERISATPFKWLQQGYTGYELPTIDSTSVLFSGDVSARYRLRKKSNMVLGDALFQFYSNKSRSSWRPILVSVLQLDSEESAESLFKSEVEMAKDGKKLGKKFRRNIKGWQQLNATGEINVNNKSLTTNYFLGKKDEKFGIGELSIAILRANRFIVSVTNASDDPFNVVEAGELVLGNLVREISLTAN